MGWTLCARCCFSSSRSSLQVGGCPRRGRPAGSMLPSTVPGCWPPAGPAAASFAGLGRRRTHPSARSAAPAAPARSPGGRAHRPAGARAGDDGDGAAGGGAGAAAARQPAGAAAAQPSQGHVWGGGDAQPGLPGRHLRGDAGALCAPGPGHAAPGAWALQVRSVARSPVGWLAVGCSRLEASGSRGGAPRLPPHTRRAPSPPSPLALPLSLQVEALLGLLLLPLAEGHGAPSVEAQQAALEGVLDFCHQVRGWGSRPCDPCRAGAGQRLHEGGAGGRARRLPPGAHRRTL